AARRNRGFPACRDPTPARRRAAWRSGTIWRRGRTVHLQRGRVRRRALRATRTGEGEMSRSCSPGQPPCRHHAGWRPPFSGHGVAFLEPPASVSTKAKSNVDRYCESRSTPPPSRIPTMPLLRGRAGCGLGPWPVTCTALRGGVLVVEVNVNDRQTRV